MTSTIAREGFPTSKRIACNYCKDQGQIRCKSPNKFFEACEDSLVCEEIECNYQKAQCDSLKDETSITCQYGNICNKYDGGTCSERKDCSGCSSNDGNEQM